MSTAGGPDRNGRVLRMLIVGTGGAAGIHTRTLGRDHPTVERWYLGRSPDRTRAAAQRWGGRAFDGDWQAALADASLAVVLITTPPVTHARYALEALAAGKHVIVEKPAFLTLDEFDRVAAAAASAGRRVCVAENYHYRPLARHLRAVVAGGTLGRVRFIQINAVKRQVARGWRSDPEVAGGGALFEGGIHWVSLLAHLGLEVRGVHGVFPDAPPGHERCAVMTLEYAQGAVASLTYSWEIPGTFRGLRLSRIWGTGGSVLFETNGLFAVHRHRLPVPRWPGLRDLLGYRAMMADFMRAITGDTPPDFTLRAARRDVELVRAAYAGASSTLP